MSKLNDKKKRNQAVILSAALELFGEKGYDDTAISDIVSKSGLARGTFYNYFPTKEAIWQKCLEDIILKINESLIVERENAHTLFDFIHNAFYSYTTILSEEHYLKLVIRNQPIFRSTLFSTDAIHSVFARLEKDMMDSSYFNQLTQEQLTMTTHAMVGTGIELLIQYHAKENKLSLEELSAFFSDLFIGGLNRISEQNQKSELK